MGEVIAARTLNELYIILDIMFLCFFAFVLWKNKQYTAITVGLLAGLIYFVVDYGGFYLLLGTRTVEGANPFLFLFWLSMSYGFTNFAWIWLWLNKDGKRLEWSLLIIAGWFTTALLSQNFGGNTGVISIARGTDSYHGIMAIILFVGYAYLIVKNLAEKDKEKRAPILDILIIGVLVQFSWEFVLLVTGIRPQGIMPLIVNSLLETNLGLPYMYLIHKAYQKRATASALVEATV